MLIPILLKIFGTVAILNARSKMGFCRRIAGVQRINKIRNLKQKFRTEIKKVLNIEILQIKSSHQHWFGHISSLFFLAALLQKNTRSFE